MKAATVSTLKECNRVIDNAKNSMNEVKLRFIPGILDWQNCGVLTVTDASFSNEPGVQKPTRKVTLLCEHVRPEG